MNLASLDSFLNNDVGSIFGKANQGATSTNDNSSANSRAITGAQPADNSQLSPLLEILSTLQQVQQSNPGQYQQLTQLIATNLQQTAQQSGNSTPANQLTQLATDFTNASNTGNLPDIADLANVIGGVGGGDAYGGSASQFQESSLSVQISFSETSVSNALQDAPFVNSNAAGGSTSAAAPSGGSQAIQQQFQESSLTYQVNLTETSTNYETQAALPNTDGTASGQPVASNQSTVSESQQLIGLITQSLQNAASAAQSNGNSAEVNLLTQLAAYFTNALDAGDPANTQGATNGSDAGDGNQLYFQAAAGDSYAGSSGSPSQAEAGRGSQSVFQQLQESLLSYQINFSESSTNGNTTNQGAFSLSATDRSLSAVF